MNPTFSIIIPVYKCEKYVEETVRSVLNQTYTDFECICVDDGSPDKSGEVLDRLSHLDSRIRVFHKDNGGVSSARNFGIEMSKGAWLLFLDADDVYRNELLQNIFRASQDHPSADMIKFGFESFDDGVKWNLTTGQAYFVSFNKIGHEVPLRIGKNTFMWQWAYKRVAVHSIRFNVSYRGMEDHPYKCEAILRCARSYAELKGIYLGYRQRAYSYMHTIPSVTTWANELRYKVDIILMSELGSRKIAGLTNNNDWAGFIFGGDFIRGIARYSQEEQSELAKVWFGELQRLRAIGTFSWKQKVLLLLCSTVKSVMFSRFVCYEAQEWAYNTWMMTVIRRFYRMMKHSGEFHTKIRVA